MNSLVRSVGPHLVPRPVMERILRFRRCEPRYRLLLQRFHIDESALFEARPSYSPLPDDARNYLRRDNPRLRELTRRYNALDDPIRAHTMWTDGYASRDIDLQAFRGDQGYVWQRRDLNTEINYYVTLNYLKNRSAELLKALSEDGLFGCYSPSFGNDVVSRDLLDSVNEIQFLERTLGLSGRQGFNVLDIGAGYGRLAHRLVEALPAFGKIFCVDAVAVSTFLCEFYLRFRGVDDRASVVPLDELDMVLRANHIDLAINIHTFSECSLTAITAWLDLLVQHEVRYLFIVPNGPWPPDGGQHGSGVEGFCEYEPLLYERGYRQIQHVPKYDDEIVQRYGVSPCEYFLLELGGGGL